MLSPNAHHAATCIARLFFITSPLMLIVTPPFDYVLRHAIFAAAAADTQMMLR